MNLADKVEHAVPPAVKPVVDALAIFVSVNAIVGALTTVVGLIAAIASAAWALIRLYETKTVQNWLARRANRRPR